MDGSQRNERKPAKIGTVALVGADGSGKSTVIDNILRTSTVPMKYIYMGVSMDASNVILPTTRLLMYIKKRRMARYVAPSERLPPSTLMTSEMKKALPSGRITKALGLMNRVAEEWYRQMHVWIYCLRGYTVICDRHFLFEYCPDAELHRSTDQLMSVRIHAWILRRLFPRPDLVRANLNGHSNIWKGNELVSPNRARYATTSCKSMPVNRLNQ
jgi:ABC-type dipeptide/oligopeptide/nickel transport system ATPase component